jgi:glyoxylase-like metal-dependent hydrolase (beta-lactamase superfamily II)/rhodanese-related sulfurtransferase
VIFRQVVHDDLGCASYLIGDEREGIAAVVDPKFEIEEYLRLARGLGVTIDHVLETHNHADHVSGHGRLASATGARIHVHRLAQPDYEHEAFDDGWELGLGQVRVRAIHAPGHRPEHTAFAVIDGARGEEPWAVLSGDSLFVGDVARPDLAVHTEAGARALFRSLHNGLLRLPDTCELWPGHLGGSLCGGAGMNMKICSTIGFERAHNPLLRIADEDEFAAAVSAVLAPQPPNFQAIVALNRGPLLKRARSLEPLTPREVEERQGDGALVVDVRTDREFDEAHVPGAVCNPIGAAGFGTKLGWIAAQAEELTLVGRDDQEALVAERLAAAVGLAGIGGYLSGGMNSWREERRATESVPRIDVPELRNRGADVQLLDVRGEREWQEGFIPGSVHKPYHAITGIPEGIDASATVAVICESGLRSVIAASLLRRHGLEKVLHVADGGVGTWRDRGWPIDYERAA